MAPSALRSARGLFWPKESIISWRVSGPDGVGEEGVIDTGGTMGNEAGLAALGAILVGVEMT